MKGTSFNQLLRRLNGTVIYPAASVLWTNLERILTKNCCSHLGTPQSCSPLPKNTGRNLRQHTHNLILPTDVNTLIKQNFVLRTLFQDIFFVMFHCHFVFIL